MLEKRSRLPETTRSELVEVYRAAFIVPPYDEDEATPLGLTLPKSGQGIAGTATFRAGVYPACSEHGAMNRVAVAPLWRCLGCNIGIEIS